MTEVVYLCVLFRSAFVAASKFGFVFSVLLGQLNVQAWTAQAEAE